MSRESKFHKLIEKQNTEEKEAFWKKLESRLESERDIDNVECGGEVLVMSKNEIEKPDDKRYCTVNDYSTEISKITIKQYAADKNLELLYFDYYEQSEYYADTQYVLSETQEVICLQEEMYDMNYAHINLYVTDDKTELDVLKSFENHYGSMTEINSVKISYGDNDGTSYAKFTFKKHVYYINVQDAPEDGYILGLLETLLN